MISITDVEITVYGSGIEIDVQTCIGSRRSCPRFGQRIIDTRLHRTVESGRAIFFHDEIDDAGRTLGAKFSRWIRDEFDFFNRSCRHLLEHLSAVFGVQSGRFAVDPNLYIFGVTERDISLLIHIDRRDILQHIGNRSAGRSDILVHGKYFLIEFKPHGTTLCYHFYISQHLRILLEGNSSDSKGFACYGDVFSLLTISHERDDERILSVGYLDGKIALFIGNRTGDEVITLHDTDVRKVDRLFRTGINHFSGQLRREGADGAGQEQECVNNLFHPCVLF